jgi:glycosyltransferase involved in cell wall biosynthesis
VRVAVLIPCFNEAATIADVIVRIRFALPGADIIVGDNACTDDTADIAKDCEARVIRESRQGKGFMVRRMFREVDADWYVLIDGDATYDAPCALEMLRQGRAGSFDFVNGVRVPQGQVFPPGHAWGNRLITGAVAAIFGHGVEDMLSGYKVLSRRFVKSFPALATGFDLETDLAVHALECGLPIHCVSTPYFSRPEGSHSKLSTFRDGWRIGRTILALLRHERPLIFFGALSLVAAALSLFLMGPILADYLRTGLVPRFPSAILSMGLMLASGGFLLTGVVGDAITRGRREMRMLSYLAQSVISAQQVESTPAWARAWPIENQKHRENAA